MVCMPVIPGKGRLEDNCLKANQSRQIGKFQVSVRDWFSEGKMGLGRWFSR